MHFYLNDGYVCLQIITAYRRKPTAYGKTVYIGKKVVKMAFVTTKQHKLHNAGADMKIRVEIDDLSSASIVSFHNTYKKVYVSRRYYKPLKDRLEERG